MSVSEITKYRTSFGGEYATREEADRQEALHSECQDALSILGERQRIAHGKWIQHEQEAVLQAKRNLLAIVRRELADRNYPVFKHSDDAIHPFSAVGRILDDFGGPMYRSWSRLMCINFDNAREYDQPYFALNPDKAA